VERRGEFETWLDEENDDLKAEDFIDPQLFIQWQGSLPRRERAAAASPPEPVNLTGTDGHRRRYSVIPATEGAIVRWLDPAGSELARSADIMGEFDDGSIRNDYELRTGPRGSSVYRTFSAPIRP
jgi:hypothetical protein